MRNYAAGLVDSGAIRPQVSAVLPFSEAVSAYDPKAEGARICAELIAAYSEIEGIAGVHLMAPLNIDSIPWAIEQSGVRC